MSCLLRGVFVAPHVVSSEMSHAIPRHVCQTLKSHRWNCNVFGCCRKFGHPNCVRVLVDEAPKVNSCVRSSSHDTVHDPRDASNTTPTPHNAKSHETPNPWGRGFAGRDVSLPLTSELLRGSGSSGFAVTSPQCREAHVSPCPTRQCNRPCTRTPRRLVASSAHRSSAVIAWTLA